MLGQCLALTMFLRDLSALWLVEIGMPFMYSVCVSTLLYQLMLCFSDCNTARRKWGRKGGKDWGSLLQMRMRGRIGHVIFLTSPVWCNTYTKGWVTCISVSTWWVKDRQCLSSYEYFPLLCVYMCTCRHLWLLCQVRCTPLPLVSCPSLRWPSRRQWSSSEPVSATAPRWPKNRYWPAKPSLVLHLSWLRSWKQVRIILFQVNTIRVHTINMFYDSSRRQ